MKWYQLKECAAGEKRLFITFYIYKIFGKNAVEFIAFFVTFFAYFNAKNAVYCSKKNLSALNIKPSFINSFKHFLSYSFSLIERMEVYSGKFNLNNIIFEKSPDFEEFKNDFKDKGIFLICSHLGNIEIMRALLFKYPKKRANVFLSKEQCKIFNGFIKKIEVKTNAEQFPVEDISLETSIKIKDRLKNGEIVIMAGDRISKTTASNTFEFLNKKISLPLGTFKFAYIMESPVYFAVVIKEKKNHKIYLKKFKSDNNENKNKAIKRMQFEYLEFLKPLALKYPYQFFHFFDFFE